MKKNILSEGLSVLATVLLNAPICCKTIWFAAMFGVGGESLQFETSEYGHLVPILVAVPVIMFTAFRTGNGIRKTVLIQKKYPSLKLWINIFFTILPVILFVPYLQENYLQATRKATPFDQIVIPIFLWPAILFFIFYSLKELWIQIIFAKLILTIELMPSVRYLIFWLVVSVSLSFGAYELLMYWFNEMLKVVIATCG
jgi:hypothetical protein